MIPAIILFAATYVLMLTFSKYRTIVALVSGLIFVATGMLPLAQLLPALDFNVLLMIAGTMGLVALFIESRMPSLLADIIMEKVPNVQMAAVALALFAGVISAFVDNVATVLMVAPVALEICRKEKAPIPKAASRTEVTDYVPSILLVGLFLMIGGISNMGVIDALAKLLAQLGGGNVFLMYTIIVWASVLISAFIDNIPYVATMIPVIAGLAVEMGCDPTVFYFGLLSGATLGGNCTPIGASANITGIGILRKAGYEVQNADFFKIGIPFTMAAVIPAYIYLWLIFGV